MGGSAKTEVRTQRQDRDQVRILLSAASRIQEDPIQREHSLVSEQICTLYRERIIYITNISTNPSPHQNLSPYPT